MRQHHRENKIDGEKLSKEAAAWQLEKTKLASGLDSCNIPTGVARCLGSVFQLRQFFMLLLPIQTLTSSDDLTSFADLRNESRKAARCQMLQTLVTTRSRSSVTCLQNAVRCDFTNAALQTKLSSVMVQWKEHWIYGRFSYDGKGLKSCHYATFNEVLMLK